MVSSRILNNDDEYIEGLLDSSPAIVDAIYRKFAGKVKHMVTGWGGNIKEAARLFEEVLFDIYMYAHHHKLVLTNHFEPFFLYACQLKWKREMTRKTPGKAYSFHPDKASANGVDAQHRQYVEAALTAGENRRYWLYRFRQVDVACQLSIRKALYPSSSKDALQPVQTINPAVFAACIATLITRGSHTTVLPAADYELINGYVVTGMPDREKAIFETQLAASPDLQANTQQYREAVEGLRAALEPDNTREELEEMMADQRQKWFPAKDHNSSSRMRTYVIITAAVAALLSGLLFLSPWHKDIYRQFAATEMMHMHRPQENDTARLLHEAAESFNDRNYRQAIVLLNQVIEKDSLHAAARYYRGVCLVDEGRLQDARTDLLLVYEGKSPYRYDAAFFTALSYLREGDKQQSLEWLLNIPETAPIYWKAEKLKKELMR